MRRESLPAAGYMQIIILRNKGSPPGAPTAGAPTAGAPTAGAPTVGAPTAGAPTDRQHTILTNRIYFPKNLGARFSAKAVTPSLKSTVPSKEEDASDSKVRVSSRDAL